MNFEQLHCTRVVQQHRRLEMRRGPGLEALSGMGEEVKLDFCRDSFAVDHIKRIKNVARQDLNVVLEIGISKGIQGLRANLTQN